MSVKLEESWLKLLADQFEQPYFKQIKAKLLQEHAEHHVVYPPGPQIFAALDYCPVDKVKAVIIGQDPYHNPGQAHGLCFSVRPGIEPPPSLKNIFRELESDVGMPEPPTGDLTPWAKEGVLLLNTTLTVREGQPQSHKGHGWETLTDAIIRALDASDHPIVFLLWGANARSKKALIRNPNHLILEAAHPSPLSAYNGFFGCRHFSRANAFLSSHGVAPVNWAAIGRL